MIDSDTLQSIAAGTLRPPGLVSLVIPHYETPELARLCLRAIRRYTTTPFEALVIDNASTDGASLDYLRNVRWIRLIERRAGEVPDNGPGAHATALNLGLREARGEFLLVMHTDTIAHRDGWLADLVEPFAADPQLAVLGGDKIDAPGRLWSLLKAVFADGKTYRRLACRLTGRPLPMELRERPEHARSFCAVYRRQTLLDEQLDFMPSPGTAAGEDVYHTLRSRGYHGRLLTPEAMQRLVLHVVHATAYLSARRSISRGRVRRRTARRIERLFHEPWVRALESDATLDE
jgi:hypothetical protein